MATEVVTASANNSVLSLARLMSDRAFSCVVITEESENESEDILATPIGIITERDIVQFQALGLNLKKIQAETVMSFPLFPVKPLDALWQAHLQMQQYRVRRLVVTGKNGELVGIITQTSLLQILDPLEMLQELEDLQEIKDEQTLQLKQTNRQLQNEIAERKRLEDALQEANRALSDLLARQTIELGVTKKVLQETEAHQQSQKQRDRFFDLSLDLFCIAGVDGYFKQINPAMEQLLGFSRSKLLAKPFIDFVHPDDRAATIAETARITQGMDTVSFENRYRCQDNSYKWLLWTGTFAAKEQLVYATAKDITERKLAEAESQRQLWQSQLISEITLKIRNSLELKEILRVSITEVQQMLQADRVLVFQLHPDGSGTVIEEAVVLGYPVVLGQDIFDPCFQAGYAAQYLQGRIGAIADIEQADIQPCYVEFLQQFAVKANLVVPIIQQSGLWGLLIVHQCDRPRHWQAVEIDLLKQLANQISIAISQAELLNSLSEKVAERTVKLERADKRLKLTQFSIDRSAEIIAWVSPNAEIIYVNNSACDILGYTRDRLLGLNISEIVPAFSAAAWAKHWQQLKDRGSLQLETSLRTKDGRVISIEAITEHLKVEEQEYNCIFARDITQRKQTESALQASEKRFKTLVANVPGAIYRCLNDDEYTLKFVDDEILAISGYRAADLLENKSLAFLSTIYSEDRDRVVREVQAAISHKRAYTIEHRIVRADGVIRWVKNKGQGVHDENDRLLWLDGILFDINERKWAETLRQLQNQVLSMLAKGKTLYDVLTKLTQGINQLSPGLSSTIMMMENDDKYLSSFINSQMPQDYIEAIDYLPIGAKVGSCGTAAYFGRRVIVSDIASNSLWADYKHLILPHGFQACWSEPIKSETGRVLGTFGLYFTEPRSPSTTELETIEACASLASIAITRKQSEAALQNSEAQLRLITDALPALIAYVDRQQCYRFVNRTYENWCKQPRTKIIGSHIKEIIGEVNYQKIQQYVELALSGKTLTYENEIILGDRQARHISATYIPDLDQAGVIKGFTALINDISDRKATERMKNEFISVVSHELRTPLTSIYGALKLLATNPESELSEEDSAMLDIAVSNTDRSIRLVNDILDLERIESGKIKMNQQPCDAADLIHQAIEVMQPMANSQEITLVTEAISILLWADPDHIHQTLTNLLSNAIKFSSPHSSVWVTVEDREHEVLFKVSDRGRGIPSDKLKRIFERFQQVNASDSRDKGGTGLGLTICYKIIEEHGGNIWVESQLSEGSTFYFTLPK